MRGLRAGWPSTVAITVVVGLALLVLIPPGSGGVVAAAVAMCLLVLPAERRLRR